MGDGLRPPGTRERTTGNEVRLGGSTPMARGMVHRLPAARPSSSTQTLPNPPLIQGAF